MTNRREVIATLGATALAAAGVDTSAAAGAGIRGRVIFEDGKAIPEGDLIIRLERSGVAEEAKRRVAEVKIKSSGKDKAVSFEMPEPAAVKSDSEHDLVASLRRHGDGWLLARGSTEYRAGAVAELTLNTVMY